MFVAAWRADPLLTPHLPALAAEPQRGATFAAFARVVAWPPGRTRALSHRVLRTTSSLRALRLVVADERAPSPLTPLRVPHRVIDFLAGVPSIDAAISAVGGAVTAPLAPALDPAHQAALERLSQAMSAPAPIIAVLEGPEGSGRRALAALAAARLQRQVVHVDLGRLARGADLDELFTALARERLLANAVPMLVGVETSRGEDAEARARRAAIAALASQLDGALVLASTEVGVGVESTRPVLRLALPLPDPATRRTLWRQALGPDAPPDDALAAIALRFHLTPAGIDRAAAAARVVAHTRGEPVRASDLAEGVRASVAERLGGLATRVVSKHAWTDLVVPADTRAELDALIARARFAYRVLEEWGFARHVTGGGIAALFSGPPGTGKTMVAGLIARELGLDLYRVDLSQIVSKWIGETEKALGRVFDAAETGHALLLFDEADALFAKRTEVKSATERYANLEVDYLLQRIEGFGGVAILTTNLDSSIDEAFRRRLAAHVLFPAPDDDERALLWQRLIPASAPRADDHDPRELAEHFADFTGGHIRNATLTAAFLAAAEGTEIRHAHLERAARDVARSMGRVFHTQGRGR